MTGSAQRTTFIQFSTKLGPEYGIAAPSFSVPSSATDRTLNEALNKMLALAGKRTGTFDFLAEGRLIRGELAAYQATAGGELKMQVEYILGIGAPSEDFRAPASRVVCKVAPWRARAATPYLAGCFDGVVEWRDAALGVAAERDCHAFEEPLQRAVLCFEVAETEEALSVYAGGAWSDIFCCRLDPATGEVREQLQAAADCAVVALAASPLRPLLWAGDCAGNVSLYSADRLRLLAAARVADSTITGLKAVDGEHLLVAARDDPMKVVEGERMLTTATFSAKDSAVTSCEALPRLSLCFSGHATGAIRAFDLRRPDRVTQLLKAHSFMVSQVAFNPHTDYQLASACHGGLVVLWDLRSDRPLYEVDAAGQHKIYSLLWESRARLISAGEDQHIVAHRFEQ